VCCVVVCLKKGPYASLKRDHPVSDNSHKYRAIYSTPRPSLLLLTQSFACSPSQHRLSSLAVLSPRLLEAPNSDSFRRCHLTFAPRDGACLVERSRAHEQLTDTDRVLGSNTICSRWEYIPMMRSKILIPFLLQLRTRRRRGAVTPVMPSPSQRCKDGVYVRTSSLLHAETI
jgi:hypothetical protein